ncbi:MAG: UDP-N-acetylmuramate:L-alanyl-gamma-D-glutamyl-meso-diaminopimelate ligase, partial [Candidatus Staskawiczbacteria bacterium]|nr:UDP-N-acetylmuramate:L-alanyl-gamma-D-glutamyl-meso-diaminopimelate ligase [Candidatus Staskawiczbacteria bacterium]
MKRYYLIGISGIAMASVAGLLKAKGYEVAGSDQKTWPPASTLLEKLKIKVFSPFSLENIKKYKPDVVIVGNAVGRNNPEVEYLLNQNIPYYSIATILKEEFIRNKRAIVITGTHGKTTTTALVAWILETANFDPTLFVGGIARNFDSSFKLGQGDYIVLEGDEYDTAFFDKGPKFWHYRPYVVLVNNIELDHVDIYKDLEAIKFSFDRLIKLIPGQGLLVCN